MASPAHSVTLSADQVEDLDRRLSNLRHNVNNYLSLIIAVAELARHKPETLERTAGTLVEQPARIVEEIRTFSDRWEQVMGISR